MDRYQFNPNLSRCAPLQPKKNAIQGTVQEAPNGSGDLSTLYLIITVDENKKFRCHWYQKSTEIGKILISVAVHRYSIKMWINGLCIGFLYLICFGPHSLVSTKLLWTPGAATILLNINVLYNNI